MTKKWIKFISELCFASLIIVLQANAAEVPDITGKYRCQGDDLFTQGTFDEPTVITKTGDTYHFLWQNKSVLFQGNGILLNNQLSIVYWVDQNPKDFGVVSYQILQNGDLKGKWTPRNGQKTGNEFCQKIKTTPAK